MRTRMKYTLCLFLVGTVLFSGCRSNSKKQNMEAASSKIETFTFVSNGTAIKGKIFLPASYEADKRLPTLFLIDYSEQHFKRATDEFEMVIAGVNKIEGFDALVVSLDTIPDIDSKPETYPDNYAVYRDMAAYVNKQYPGSSNTFIGRGSESSIVLMALFLENPTSSVFDNFIATDPSPLFNSTMVNVLTDSDFPAGKKDKKLHFSYSKTNSHEKCSALINLMEEAQLPWLQFESVAYTNSDYENTYPVAFADGIAYIFRD